MKILAVIFLAMGAVGCKTMEDNQEQQYILKLADKCEVINISPRGTDLQCPNYRERSKDDRASNITQVQD